MRPMERVAVFGGVVAAIVISLGGGHASTALAGRQTADVKIGTVDIYQVAEKLMSQDELKKVRDDASASWQQKASIIEKDLRQLEENFKVLPQNDPQVADITRQAQAKQAEYQKLAQERQQELEKLNSSQLIVTYGKVRAATKTVAERLGYAYVLSSRPIERAIETQTVSTTLQEFLARPVIVAPPSDDLTKAVLDELKIAG